MMMFIREKKRLSAIPLASMETPRQARFAVAVPLLGATQLFEHQAKNDSVAKIDSLVYLPKNAA